jgi:hypothetical protein
MARRSAARQPAREQSAQKAPVKNASVRASGTLVPPNEDPNQPGISDVERLARQKALIQKRIAARQKVMELEQMEKKARGNNQ